MQNYPTGQTMVPPGTPHGMNLATPSYSAGSTNLGSPSNESWQSSGSAEPQVGEDGFYKPQIRREGDAGNKSVPNYEDPAFEDQSSSATDSKPKVEETPVPPKGNTAIKEEANPFGQTSAERFEAPIMLTPASSIRQASAAVPDRPNPYDYDAKNFSWLRGTISYDQQEHAWNLIYNLTPNSSDPYGGSITLKDDPRLDTMAEDDVVIVEGAVDTTATNRLGKPLYGISQIARLQPKE